jgi:hypothetical protein
VDFPKFQKYRLVFKTAFCFILPGTFVLYGS